MSEYFSYYRNGDPDYKPFKVFGSTQEERDRVAAFIDADPVDMEEYRRGQKVFIRKQRLQVDWLFVFTMIIVIIGGICQIALVILEHKYPS